MKHVNIVVGRFQPFTLGHLKCCTRVYLRNNIPTVLCIIDTTKTDDRHPFLTKMMWSAFKNLVNRYDEIEDILLVKNADITKIKEALEARDYEIVYWTCGTDRIKPYKKMCEKYAPEVTVIEIPRDDNDISATQVRKAIKNNDEQTFKQLTPQPMHTIYKKLYDAIIKEK